MNLIQINEAFPTELDCIVHLEQARYGKKPKCGFCDSVNLGVRLKDHRFTCKDCRKTSSVTAGTALHRTRIPLKTWFYAFAIITDAKKGVSALQLQRNLGVSYPTAWNMYMTIRELMVEDNGKLDGVVEMDETYIGGKPRKNAKMMLTEGQKEKLDYKLYDLKQDFEITEGEYKKKYPKVKPKRGRGTTKISVVGIVQRDGNVVAEVMEKLTARNLRKMVQDNVKESESILVTDEYSGYNRLSEIIEHIKIDHQKMWSYKGINTNSIESFWAIVKRGIIGQYHQVSPKYLPNYVAEFVFKYNNRHEDDMFETLVKNAVKTNDPTSF
ncbi:MAG: IS1595 family transposase [Flavobacteriales bacterium]|nr:IS1595 family transposase [Flavobacteriales bacterium]